MKAVDTNVLARLILQDDEQQMMIARRIVGEPVWVSSTVWIELGWVLDRRLGLDRTIVADALQALLMIETIRTADRAGLDWAIERFRAGADWADMVHLVAARGAADSFATFDRGVGSRAGPDSPVVVETLA